MFTGIITATAKVLEAKRAGDIVRVSIEKPKAWKLTLGESIAVDGICSTVVAKSAKAFAVEYMPETLKKTTAGAFAKGTVRNLERSLTLGTLIDGHLVQGHVDARANVASIVKGKDGYLISFTLPQSLLPYSAEHGSIAINGVSLTIARKKGKTITVALIPHTLAHTNLGGLKKGDDVNIEVDLVARYLGTLMRYGRR
jgi:riboflavin synthase